MLFVYQVNLIVFLLRLFLYPMNWMFFTGPETKFIHPTDFDEKVGIQCELI